MKILHKIKTVDCEIYVVLNFFSKKWYTFIALNCFFPKHLQQTYSDQTDIFKKFFCFKLRLTKCIHWSMAQLFQQLCATLQLQEILI